MFADLHMHSIHSDGLLSVERLIQQAKEKEISVISITDHDTLDGYKALHKSDNVVVVPGIELTVTNKLHILGYFVDTKMDIFERELAAMKMRRAKWLLRLITLYGKNNCSVKNFIKKYKDITYQSVYQFICDNKFISKEKYYESLLFNDNLPIGKMPSFTSQEAIQLIKEAGGVPVLAHPGLLMGDMENFMKSFKRLVKEGLQGVEIFHVSNSEENIKILSKLVHKYNLLVTGGSDYHGNKNKNTIIGEYGIGLNEWQHLMATTSYEERCKK